MLTFTGCTKYIRHDQFLRRHKKAHTLQQLIAVGQARGMKNPVGWAKHVHNARQRS
jgi:hypothetical protein